MQVVKTYVMNLDSNEYKHLIDYEKAHFEVSEIEHIIDQMRYVHYQLKYNLIVEGSLLLFFDEF